MKTMRFILSLIQITSLIACEPTLASQAKPFKKQIHKKFSTKPRQSYPSLREVFDRICNADIKFPVIVMKQVILETGWLKSDHLMSRNNLFGFRSKHYMRFNNWEDSVAHYKTWQLKKLTVNDNDYYRVLDRVRYGAPGYITNLKKIKWSQECSQGNSSSNHQDQRQQLSNETVLDAIGSEEN
jgi:hypothetical protein